ncbi:oligosaccharyl transferase STT3 subunit [Plasmodium gonderi]|uniref:dolichyl-diphosphooligosaccharide--protein glycotransferase n=1 Tax=Plasmodium gonderi TaxID=77519 RepID=A0A1Y1JLK8_PLAGO|nr:oligosaccharyl transferase STT3 subunit [Plasmodium gonderi]GAW80934.1 oligosaccharyl transferase STT3 subunit [Plasmodium gonderi]
MVNREDLEENEEEDDLRLKPRFVLNRFLHNIFCCHAFRRAMKEAPKWRRKMEILILLLIGVLSFLIRLFSVIRNEAIIHEFDPYFNYKLTRILKEKEFYEFWNYFDEKSWFPLGRTTGQTLFPGLMVTILFIYQICHYSKFLIDLKNLCIYIGPIFSFLTCIITYLLTKEIHHFGGTGLIASLFVSISPSHVSRTVAGSYDNESIAIFLLLVCIYNWVRCLKKGTLLSALITSLSTYYMALSWGAYIYITNSVSLYMLILIIMKRYTVKNVIVFNVYYVLTTALCLTIPCIHKSVFISIEHLGTHAIFVLTNMLLLLRHVILCLNMDEEKFANNFIKICFIFFILIFKFIIFTNKLSWNHRSRTLLDPTYASKHNPVVASISEHQPTTWSSYFFDVHLVLLFVPIGLYECLKKQASIESFFLGIFSLLSLYFSALMVRLLLIFSPIASILSAIGLSSIISRYVRFLRIPPDTFIASLFVGPETCTGTTEGSELSKLSVISDEMRTESIGETKIESIGKTKTESIGETKIESIGKTKTESIGETKIESIGKTKTESIGNSSSLLSGSSSEEMGTSEEEEEIRKLNFNRTEKNSVSIVLSLCILIVLAYFVILSVLHSTWCSSVAYSESNIIFYSRNENGERYINDDVRQMYKWIYENTEPDSKIVAWWDYGYQLNVMSDRITYVDNNTWNNMHIATVGLILSVNEKQAYEYLKKLDADYILVSYGGYSKNSSDDLNKFLWILKITNKKFNHINPLLYYYHDQYHPLGKNASTSMSNSLLYRLSYYNISNSKIKGYDYVRKLQVPEIKELTQFEEVFTSDVWGFRLYKVRDYI